MINWLVWNNHWLVWNNHFSLLCQKSQCQRKEVLKHGHLADPLAYQVGPVVS
jgi:hypothetical protein